jgi:small subunit ribosomal protein S14
VAKVALIQRELKRAKLVAKFAKKYAELKSIAGDAKRSEEERASARAGLQALPRNANPNSAWPAPRSAKWRLSVKSPA